MDTNNAAADRPEQLLLHDLRPVVAAALDFIIDVWLAPRDEGEPDIRSPQPYGMLLLQQMDQYRLQGDPASTEMPESPEFAVVLWNDELHSFPDVIDILREATNMSKEDAENIAIAVDQHGRHVVQTSATLNELIRIANIIRSVGLGVSLRCDRDTRRECATEAIVDWLLGVLTADRGAQGQALTRELRRLVCQELLAPYRCGLVDPSLATTDEYNAEGDNDFSRFRASRRTLDAELEGEMDFDEDEDDEDPNGDGTVERVYPDGINNAARPSLAPESHLGLMHDYRHIIREIRGAATLHTVSSEQEGQLRPRIIYLMLHDAKQWKQLRQKLKELYVATLVVEQDFKPRFAAMFADIYPRLAAIYAHADRETEHSILHFSVQMFTTPTIATLLTTRHWFYDKLLALLMSFFTANQTPNFGVINVDAPAFRTRSYAHLTNDIKYLVNAPGVQETILNDFRRLKMFTTFQGLFEGMHPQRRYADVHVEFEGMAWAAAFNVSVVLTRLADHYAQALMTSRHMSPEHFHGKVKTVLGEIAERMVRAGGVLELKEIESTPRSLLGVAKRVSDAISGGITSMSVKPSPSNSVSLHHPLLWLLAKLVVPRNNLLRVFDSPDLLLALFGQFEVPGLLSHEFNGSRARFLINLFDLPLSSYVMLSQIQCGVWVRNGLSIRAQCQTYTSHPTCREGMLDNDLFLLQIAAVVLGGDHFIAMVVDKFELAEWYHRGSVQHPVYSTEQVAQMIEEMLLLLIYLYSDRSKTTRVAVDMSFKVRQAILQWLALGPRPHSQLVKVMPEDIAEYMGFDDILKELSTYRAPEGPTEKGRYELRDQFLGDVTLFYKYYTRNHRIELEEAMQKKHKASRSATPWMSTPPGIPPLLPAFLRLEELVSCRTFVRLMTACMRLALHQPASVVPDSLVEAVCYLLMLAVQQSASTVLLFVDLAVSLWLTLDDPSVAATTTLMQDLLLAYAHPRFAGFKSHLDHVFARMSQTGHAGVREALSSAKVEIVQDAQGAQDQAKSEAEQKKQAAKERQARILAEMAKQQASFMDQFGDEDFDDEDDANGGDVEMQDATHDPAKAVTDKTSIKEYPTGQCIICQENLSSEKLYGVLGRLEKSRVARHIALEQPQTMQNMMSTVASLDCAPTDLCPNAMDDGEQLLLLEPATNTAVQSYEGIHMSSCGHLIHHDCMAVYLRNLRIKHDAQRTRNHPEDLLRREFMCPLCKGLRNVVVPIAWADIRETAHNTLQSNFDVATDQGELATWVQQGCGGLMQAVEAFKTTEASNVIKAVLEGNLLPSFQRVQPEPTGSAILDSASPAGQLAVALSELHQQIDIVSNGDRAQPVPEVRSAAWATTQAVQTLTYTLTSMEIAARESADATSSAQPSYQGVFVSRLSDQSLTALRVLSRAISTSILQSYTDDKTLDGRSHLIARMSSLSTLLLHGHIVSMSPQVTADASATCTIEAVIDQDPFVLLVEASLLLCELPAVNLQRMMQWLFVVEVLRSLRTLCQQAAEWIADPESPGARTWANAVRMLDSTEGAQLAVEGNGLTQLLECIAPHVLPLLGADRQRALSLLSCDAALCQWIRRTTLSFLRRASLLMYAKYGQIPLDLAPRFDANFATSFDASVTEYERLTTYLGLPALSSLHTLVTSSHEVRSLVDKYMAAPTSDLSGGNAQVVRAGLFFNIRDCVVVALHNRHGALMQAPYLDIHGETDIGLRRGKPMFLSQRRVEDLRKMWVTQEVASRVAWDIEASFDHGNWYTY
ncbi:E3 ubiquitin-protein ligase ubr1 [Sorochytrium milnesiophthora]